MKVEMKDVSWIKFLVYLISMCRMHHHLWHTGHADRQRGSSLIHEADGWIDGKVKKTSKTKKEEEKVGENEEKMGRK